MYENRQTRYVNGTHFVYIYFSDYPLCLETEYQCSNGQCIDKQYVCYNSKSLRRRGCADGSHLLNCSKTHVHQPSEKEQFNNKI